MAAPTPLPREALDGLIARAGATPLGAVRRAALERFGELGAPTTRLEEWRYTPAASLAKLLVTPAEASVIDRGALEALFPAAPEGPRLVFSAGRLVPELSTPPAGISIRSFDQEMTLIEPALRGEITRARDGFEALHLALATEGLILRVPRTAILGVPLHLVHLAPRAGAGHTRIDLELERGASLTLIETFLGSGEAEGVDHGTHRITVGRDAVLHHVRVVKEPERAHHLGRVRIELDGSARYEGLLVHAGGATARTEITAELGERADFSLGGLYLTRGEEISDCPTVVVHRASHGRSRQLFKGIVADRSIATFYGKVRVDEHTAGNDARQTNKNLLLGEGATANTRPQLEIYADDVQCAHGATVGRLDEQQVFYLRSRGLDPEVARAMLTWAFAGEVLDLHAPKEARTYLSEVLASRLGAGGVS